MTDGGMVLMFSTHFGEILASLHVADAVILVEFYVLSVVSSVA